MWAHSNKKSIISIWRSLKYKMVAALHSSVVPGIVPAFQLPYVSSLHRQMALCLHWRPRLLATGSLFLLKLRRRQCKCVSVKGWCHSVSGPGVYLTLLADWGCLRSDRGWVVLWWVCGRIISPTVDYPALWWLIDEYVHRSYRGKRMQRAYIHWIITVSSVPSPQMTFRSCKTPYILSRRSLSTMIQQSKEVITSQITSVLVRELDAKPQHLKVIVKHWKK